jgi:hypothetical protein
MAILKGFDPEQAVSRCRASASVQEEVSHRRRKFDMSLTLQRGFAAIILVLSFAAPLKAGTFDGIPVCGSFENAEAIYKSGDYATALPLLRSFADQGNAFAQLYLSEIYERDHDYTQARAWRDKAAALLRAMAEQGNATAQFHLAKMY